VTPVSRSIWRRISRIGSTERTRGMTSKLLAGGGEVVNHSSVFPFHGSGPAIAPVYSPSACWTKKVRLKPQNMIQNDHFPTVSFISRPVIFGYQ
jgi:hypothetical protein